MIGEQSEVGKTKLNAGRKKAESGRSHGAAVRDRCRNFAGRPQPHGDAQINGDGLN